MELSKEFIQKNKRALIEEISQYLNQAKQLIINASLESDTSASAFIGVSNAVGEIDACFKQYLLFCKGEIPQHRTIGFGAFEEEDDIEAVLDDEDVLEPPNPTK